MTDMFRLDGKVAVVTGGGRGIGLMMARGLLQAGATVYLSSRKKAELDAAVAELSAHGPVQAIPADLGTIDGVQALVADLGERTDAVHALYNNAGAAWGAPLGEFPESGFDKVFNVNVKGVFLLTRALVPMLTAGATEGDPARVINTGSIDGIVPPGRGRDNFSYSASKAAVHMLTQHLAGELAPRILVNAIAPGPILAPPDLTSAQNDRVIKATPLARWGGGEEIARAVVFLIETEFVTGECIRVDGGRHLA